MLVWVGVPQLKQASHLCKVRRMSLNRIEKILFDYVENHAEERQFWTAKVRGLMTATREDFATAAALAIELRYYFEERHRVGALPREVFADCNQPALTSFRNLAEYLMRIWGPARPERPRPKLNERP